MAKGINIFDSAKGKPKPSSSAKEKPMVEVDGIEAQLNELQNLKTQIANLETELDVVTDEIKTIAKEKFVELYLENGRNPNTFLLKDGSGCVMVIPTDKYISIKDEDRANQLIETYGEDIVTIDEKYYFNPEVLERNMKAIEKLIRDAKSISDADKQNLLIREVKYSVTKGTIDELYDYGEDMEAVINDIQPIITLKNCGGKMAEGGTDGEFIANVYDDYDAEAGSTVTSMYAKGGMMKTYQATIMSIDPNDQYGREQGDDKQKYGLSVQASNTKDAQIKAVEQFKRQHGNLPIYWVKVFADGGMMAKGGKISDMTYIGTLYDADDAMNAKKELLKTGNFTDIKIQKVKQAYQLNKYARGNENYFMWRIYVDLTDDIDSPSKYEKLSKKWKSIIQKNETYKGRHKVYADGGIMSENTYDNILLQNGFKKVKTLAGVRFFQKGDIFASVDDLNHQVEITKREGQVIYRGNSIREVIYVVTEKMALGGFFGGSSYNRSWHQDHYRHNKKESYEIPMNKRSRRFKRK